MLSELIALEQRVDSALPRLGFNRQQYDEFLAIAQGWAMLVWELSASSEIQLSADDIQTVQRLNERPVFVCGVHRSGTTLVRNLLDGHSKLMVLPTDAGLFQAVRKAPNADLAESLAKDWVVRLAKNALRAPFWLLGRTTHSESPSVRFAGLMRKLSDQLSNSSEDRYPAPAGWMACVFGAFGISVFGSQSLPQFQSWVEKTPTNESNWPQLKQLYPHAKCIHVIRDPVATFRSRLNLEMNNIGGFPNRNQVLKEMATSYRLAQARLAGNESHYLVVRYEDVVHDRTDVIRRISQFLGIPLEKSMLQPTVLNHSVTPNSSYDASTLDRQLSERDLSQLAQAVRLPASQLGYAMPPEQR